MSYFNLKAEIVRRIREKGGWVNCHAHFDRAFSITQKNFYLSNKKLQEKWHLVDELKAKSTVSQIFDRMAFATEEMLKQGVQAVATFIDVDEVIKDKAIKAAEKIRQRYQKEIKIKFVNQTLKGVVDKKARYWFKVGAKFVDIIGGLPAKDKGHEEEHIEIVLGTAKSMGKMAHLHVDQLNSPFEKETELLARKTIELKMEGKVVAIHGISIAAQNKDYRHLALYPLMKKAKLMVIACPTAWIDSQRSEVLTPTHNAVTPVDELALLGITVGLGTDNIADIYKPFTDGDMWTELRFLLETCHFYNLDQLVDMATVNGLKILGIS